jgi:AhpD family alkylhydroperoxidase
VFSAWSSIIDSEKRHIIVPFLRVQSSGESGERVTAWVAPSNPSRQPKTDCRHAEKHFGAVLNPTRWWGRMPRLFWLVALFVGFLERRHARLTPVLRSLLMTRVSQLCHCAFCIDANSLRLAERCGALDKVQAVSDWQIPPCSVSRSARRWPMPRR